MLCASHISILYKNCNFVSSWYRLALELRMCSLPKANWWCRVDLFLDVMEKKKTPPIAIFFFY